MPATVDTSHMDAAKKVEGDRVVYSMHYSNENPTIAPQTQSTFDLAPRFSVSTFKDYDSLASAYSALALPMSTVMPAIRAKAEEIMAGSVDRRDQALKIYDWISTHVRYVALEFGQGSIVPHSADHVLSVGYGDCKDHAILFAALLKAKGIDSNLALINAGNTYTVAKVPSLAPFNHPITWLSEFRLYADTTNGRVVPFGLLPLPEYGKPVLHVGNATGALHQPPPYEHVYIFGIL
jgi:Transglutaminase-like superfamily